MLNSIQFLESKISSLLILLPELKTFFSDNYLEYKKSEEKTVKEYLNDL